MWSEKPICAPSRLSYVSLRLPLKPSSSVGVIDGVLSRKVVEQFLSLRLSPPVDRWCNILSFVYALSSSTLQIFRDTSHVSCLLCQQDYLLDHFPWLQHVQGSISTGIFEGRRWTLKNILTHTSVGFPFTFCRRRIDCEDDGKYVWSGCHLLRQLGLLLVYADWEKGGVCPRVCMSWLRIIEICSSLCDRTTALISRWDE